jgi:hypothetical protein
MLYRQPGLSEPGLRDFAEEKQCVFVDIHGLRNSLPSAWGKEGILKAQQWPCQTSAGHSLGKDFSETSDVPAQSG